LSAVRVQNVERDAFMVTALREHADGGVLSNFPVWLFDVEDRDTTRPTFGFKLVGGKSVGGGLAHLIYTLGWAVEMGPTSSTPPPTRGTSTSYRPRRGCARARSRPARWEPPNSTSPTPSGRACWAPDMPPPEASASSSPVVAVGTAVAGGPPRRSQRARLAHWAPASGSGVKAHVGPGMQDAVGG